jgi:hypothetical protein
VEAEVISKIVIVAWSLLCVVDYIWGMHNAVVHHLDSDIALVLSFLFHLFLWGLVVVPTAVIGLLFKKKAKEV